MYGSFRAYWRITRKKACRLPTFRSSDAARRSSISRGTMGRSMSTRGRAISVKDALVGINQLIDETGGKGRSRRPCTAEP